MNKQIMLELKERSHRKVFSLIRAQGSVSGALLSKQTEMQPSSLVYILRHLKEKDLIRLSGFGSSTKKGGKRPVLWEVNPDYGIIMGLEVMRQGIRAVLVNLAGDVMMKVEKEFKPGRTEKNISRIINTIKEIINESGSANQKLLYISIAIPGIVDPRTHTVLYSYGLKMEEFDMKSRIEEHFNIPIGIINDANAGALGEQWFNTGENIINNILYLMYNPMVGGIGLGIVVNRKLYTGSNGIAGELVSRIPSLEEIIKEILLQHPEMELDLPPSKTLSEIQIADLYSSTKRDCPLSKSVLHLLSRQVAKEINKITGLFDPERITLGGDLSICENLCCDEINRSLEELLKRSYPFKVQIPQIHYARSKVFSAAIGSTALFLSDELSL